VENAPTFSVLIPQAKIVIRTLWKYQVESFGPDTSKRWGFTVKTEMPGWMQFTLGVLELLRIGLVIIDDKGLVFLADHGIQFCEQHNTEIQGFPYFYSHFAS